MVESIDWWDRWWQEDFTWEGLANKPWRGWMVPENVPARGKLNPECFAPDPSEYPWEHRDYGARPEGWRTASLQDYWRKYYSDEQLIAFETTADAGKVVTKHFTPFHLPLHWRHGEPTGKSDWDDTALDEVIERAMSESGSSGRSPISGMISLDRRCQLSGGVFKGFRSRQPAILAHQNQNELINLHWNCQYCFFEGGANFQRVIFENANFENADFEGQAFFEGASFLATAGFECARFEGQAIFNNTSFDSTARFGGVSFEELAHFENVRFEGYADFKKTIFCGVAAFRNSIFEGAAKFECARFRELALFEFACFEGNALFRGASLEKSATFQSASFEKHAIFENAVFWQGVVFSGRASDFRTASVNQSLKIKPQRVDAEEVWSGELKGEPVESSFARTVFRRFSFANGICVGGFWFENRAILEGADFRQALFLDLAKFSGSKLHQGVSFQEARFRDALRMDQRHRIFWRKREPLPKIAFFRMWSGTNAVRVKRARRTRLRFFRSWKHDDCRYGTAEGAYDRARPPLVEGALDYKSFCEVHVAQRNEREAFEDDSPDRTQAKSAEQKRNAYYDELERCFRTLKVAMEDTRDRNMEAHFFQLELKARRQRTGREMHWFEAMFAKDLRDSAIAWWEPLFSDAYGALSAYGTSIMRPIVWIVGLMLCFASVYFMLGSLHFSPWRLDWAREISIYQTSTDLWNSLSYSASRMLGFGALGGDLHEGSLLYPIIDPDSEQRKAWSNFGVRVIGTVQSILAIILVFLSGLAVRRKFQIT